PTTRPAKSKTLKSPPVPWSQRQQAMTTAARAQLTPLRLIAVAVCLTVTLMGYVLYRQARWSHAQSTVQASIDAGTEALNQRDFPKAAAALDEAATALTILGRHDDAAQTIQRLAREAMVCDGLSAESLPQMLTELFEQHDATDLSTRFARRCAGRWILFDAPLYLAADEKKSVLFDLPLLVEKELVEVRLDGHPWPSLLSGSTAALPTRVIFAAQLDRLEPATKKNPVIRLWLRSDTAVLWSERETLEALDLLPTDADQLTVVDGILSTQRDVLKARE
ncbi:MAG: hypothetical protein SH850_24010, partial [Planctomycetaceae bacterium]|nr:hypothetical protein [Planctomycetaceae bacterium]